MNTETLSTILDLLSGALTPVIAIIAICIAYQQYKVKKLEVRLALYDKRFLVYQSVMSLLGSVLKNGNISSDDLSQFYTKTAESYFLFGHEVSDYLTDMKKKAIRLKYLNERTERAPISDECNKLVDEEFELVEWFNNQFDEATELFAEYLRFKKI